MGDGGGFAAPIPHKTLTPSPPKSRREPMSLTAERG
jgi:hypothetical protein